MCIYVCVCVFVFVYIYMTVILRIFSMNSIYPCHGTNIAWLYAEGVELSHHTHSLSINKSSALQFSLYYNDRDE